MHRQMRETGKSAWMTGGGFGQSVVIVPCQSDSLGAWHDVGSWTGDREDLYSDPARIHVRQSRVAEVSQLVPLHDLSPDDVGPRKAAAADGGGVDTADDSRNGVMLFQRDHAHSVSPDLLGRAKHVSGACTNLGPLDLANGLHDTLFCATLSGGSTTDRYF